VVENGLSLEGNAEASLAHLGNQLFLGSVQ
jgi:hypothetical protein